MAVPATGRRVEVAGIGIDQVADGKLAELWQNTDDLGLEDQLSMARTPPSQ